MTRLCFDYGHGGTDSGAIYKGRKESDDVLSLGKEVAEEVRRHGVEVDEIRTKDITVGLKNRSDFEKRCKYDYFISFHRNAFKPEQASGVETYTYINSEKAEILAKKIQQGLVGVGFKDRGVKAANFHVLRGTKSPAVLIEIGFIDNTEDNKIFDEKRNEIIQVISKAILDELGVKYEVSNPPSLKNKIYYRVMAGSFNERKNAENQALKLKKLGIESTIITFSK